MVVADLNNDYRADLVVATPDKLICVFGAAHNRLTIPLENTRLTSLTLVDFDNDGWLDIVGAGDGLQVWRNLGQAGFFNVSRKLGLPNLTHGPIESLVAADFDNDCDVDAADFQHFKTCALGPAVAQTDPACADARLDADGDVDLDDFGIFQRCYSGAGNPADPNCNDTCSGDDCDCLCGQTNCDGTCANTASNNANCGTCGNVCAKYRKNGALACSRTNFTAAWV